MNEYNKKETESHIYGQVVLDKGNSDQKELISKKYVGKIWYGKQSWKI